MKCRALFALCLSVAVVMSVRPDTPAAQSVVALSDSDYREIKALVMRYNLGWDNAAPADNGSLVGSTFAPDVVFLNAGGVRAGRKAVADSAARAQSGLQHWVSNLLVDPAPTGATGWSYVLLVTVDGDGQSARITGGGVYRDVYEKTAEGWRIKHRIYDAVTDGEAPSWPWDTRTRRWGSTRPVRALRYDQVHFGVPDPERAAEWYRERFGGVRIQEAVDPRVMLGTTRLIFLRAEHAGPSAGSVFDHIAFTASDVDAAAGALVVAGARLVEPAHDESGGRTALLDDPWGIRIELVQGSGPAILDHVHLRVPDPDRTMQWYIDAFGGETGRVRGVEGVRYGPQGHWLLMDAGRGAPSAGRAIDHLGWDTPDVQQSYGHLKGRGVSFLTEPRSFGGGGAFFIEGQNGDKLEVVQR